MEMPYSIDIVVRDKGGGATARTQTLGKIKKIRADLSENMLKSGHFITILHKNSGKLSTTPPPPPENISPVLLCLLMDFEASHDVEKVIH
jgi:hypothetical protein